MPMRIGELAGRVGVSTDTVRFYERSGWRPRPARQANAYREYAEADVEHLRLLIDLRRLDIPLDAAAELASWCHAGHCGATADALPSLLADRRAAIADRMAGLEALDARLAGLERHIADRPRRLAVIDPDGSCCETADAVRGAAEGGCTCCEVARDVSAVGRT